MSGFGWGGERVAVSGGAALVWVRGSVRQQRWNLDQRGGSGWAVATEEQRHHSVVHEFFHVLRFQSGGSRGPEWLLEGSARYVEFVVAGPT